MVTVIGLGFVGLTTGLGLAQKGFKVYGVDISSEKTDALKSKKVPFFEPHLEEVLAKELDKNFILSSDLQEAIKKSETIFFCVGTPAGEDGSADLTYLLTAIDSVLRYIDKDVFKVLVIKSTIPPSTTKERIKPHIENLGFKIGKDIGLANNPEFLREGYAWDDFMNPDRVVVGVEDAKSLENLSKIYEPFDSPFYGVSYNTGEYIKYLSNTLLSTLISFANEQSMIAHSVGDINIAKAFKILHEDKRWTGAPASMSSYVYPGCGFGGYCLPKDTQALLALSRQKGFNAAGLSNVLEVNQNIKKFHIDRIAATVSKTAKLGILGLSFKPNSDDVRDSPAYQIIKSLLEIGYQNILAYDPISNEMFDKHYGLPIKYCSSMTELLDQCDTVVILTGWQEFKEKKELLTGKKVFDLRYILN